MTTVSLLRTGLAALLVGALGATPASAQLVKGGPKTTPDQRRAQPAPLGAGTQQDVLDFESLMPGAVIGQVYGAGGLGPVLVTGFSPAFGVGVDAALVFDSDMRTGGDPDLGSPNSDFGGPGIDAVADGLGGEAGSPFQNDTAQHRVLVIAEDLVDADDDGLVDDPDDGDLPGSTFYFDFSALGSVTLHAITVLDVEAEEESATVSFLDAGGNPVAPAVILPHTGDNGLAVVDLGDVPGVVHVAVQLNGSGAIDDLVYSVAVPCDSRIGDFVWLDEDCDGLQDPGEPGLANVRVILKNANGRQVQHTQTDATGHYLFEGLCAGDYRVCVDPTTLPPGATPAPCNAGADDELDNDCDDVLVALEPGEEDRSIDFGFCLPDDEPGTEGCTPGYWKQAHHFDSWPAAYSPDMLFSEVFDDAFPGKTLVQVLAQGGGGLKALGRHTVAALLNAAALDYDVSAGEVVDLFNGVFPGGDYEGLKNVFAGANESLPCPLN